MFWASLAGTVSHPQPRRIEEPGPAEALISEPRARTKRGWGEAQAADLLSVMGTQRTRKRGGPSRECSQNQRERGEAAPTLVRQCLLSRVSRQKTSSSVLERAQR